MRLPSSSSLLLATLASSSSLSALAAPSGDRPEDSSVSLRSDDTTVQSNNRLQGRGVIDETLSLGPVKKLVGAVGNILMPPPKEPKARAENSPRNLVGTIAQEVTGKPLPIQMAARAEESGADSPSQNESASQAPSGNGVKPPAPPVNNIPSLPVPLPVNPPSPPLPLPIPGGAPPVKGPGRRDLPPPLGGIVSGVVGNSRIPPVQRELPPDAVGQ